MRKCKWIGHKDFNRCHQMDSDGECVSSEGCIYGNSLRLSIGEKINIIAGAKNTGYSKYFRDDSTDKVVRPKGEL